MDSEEPLIPKHSQFEGEPIVLDAIVANNYEKLVVDDEKITLGTQTVSLADAIGLVCQGEDQDSLNYLYCLYSYPRRKRRFRKQMREVERLEFQIPAHYQRQIVEKAIVYRIANRPIGASLKVLICFNPNAGSNSRNHLQRILHFFKKTNLEPELFTTQHRGHCQEHLKTLDPKQYCAVAIVSGDGLMHEYVNSMCKIPVTHVPAGSGNAFSKTQTDKAGQLCKDEESIFLVIKNRRFPFNMVKYELEKVDRPVYSFLSLEWALLGDIDMNSEFLRCLGGLRFEVYTVWRLIKMKRYRARITYSKIESQMPPLGTDLFTNPNYVTVEDTFLNTIFCTIPYISDKFKIAPCVKIEEKLIDYQTVRESHGRMSLTKYLLSCDSGSQFNLEEQKPADGFNFDFHKVKSFRLEPLDPLEPGVFGIDGESYESQAIQASFCDETFQSFI